MNPEKTISTYYLIGFLLLSFLQEINSQVLVLEEPKQAYSLDEHLRITESFSSAPLLNQLINPTDPIFYKPLNEWSEGFKPQKIYVSQVQIENNLPNSDNILEWVLKFPLAFTDITVFSVDNLGNIQTAKSGSFPPLTRRLLHLF